MKIAKSKRSDWMISVKLICCHKLLSHSIFAQQTNTSSKSTIKNTRCEIWSKFDQNDISDVILVSLLLTLNILHTFF